MKKASLSLALLMLLLGFYPSLAQNHPNGIDYLLEGITYPDFTWAGIRRGPTGQVGIPDITGPVFTVTGFTKEAIDLQVAAAAAAGGGVVFLPEGVYELSDKINITADNIVIRGAGPDKTTVRLNGITGGNVGAFNFVGGGPGGAFFPAGDILRGARSFQLSSTFRIPVPGETMLMEIATLSDEYLGNFMNQSQHRDRAFHTVNVVQSVSGNTVTLLQPVRVDFLARKNYSIKRVSMIKRCGVEDLRLEASRDLGPGTHGVRFLYGFECWTKNLYIYKASSWPIRYEASKFCEARNSTWEDSWNKGGGGVGYGGLIGSYDGLMDGISMINLRHAPNFQDQSNGCVVRNSTAISSDMQWHRGQCTENLVELFTNSQGSAAGAYSFSTGHIASFLDPGAGPRNVLYNNDLSWNGRGVWFGGFNSGWVFSYNRLRSGGRYSFGYLIHIADKTDGLILAHNVFAMANNGGAGAVYFNHGWTNSAVDIEHGISYTHSIVNGDTVRNGTKNVEFIRNQFYGFPENKRWVLRNLTPGLNPNLDQNNTWTLAYNPLAPPARPQAPFPSLYEWQISQINVLSASEEKAAIRNKLFLGAFPNPTSGHITLQFSEKVPRAKNVRLEVFNALGQKVLSKTDGNVTQTFDFAGLGRGVFYLWLTADGISESKKVVVQ